MELQDWRKEPRKNYSNEFKLRMVELASQPGACVAQIARENGVNDNVIFKWLRLWQNEGRVSRRLPVTTSSDTGVELLPVEITPATSQIRVPDGSEIIFPSRSVHGSTL